MKQAQIRKMFNEKIIEKNLFEVFMKFNDEDNLNKLEFYESNLQQVNFFKKKVFDYGSKYYLQNKQKEELNNIQESLREKVNHLNSTFSDNAYFLKIEKETLEKRGNKHNYNVFKIFLLEYHKINLFNDIIMESENFFTEGFFPLQFSNLPINLKIEFYEKIIKFIKKNKNLINLDEDNNIEFHDLLLINLKREMFSFFIKLFHKDKQLKYVLSELFNSYPSMKCSPYYDIENFLELLLENPTPNNLTTIEKVLSIFVLKKWDISMNILNLDLMEQILEEMKEEDIFQI